MDKRRPSDDVRKFKTDLDVSTIVRLCERSNFPVIKTSRQIGYYSVDGDMKFRPDDTELKYLKMPTNENHVNFDLNLAYAQVVKFISSNTMDSILRWILHNTHRLMDDRNRRFLNADFVCFRGVLHHIMRTPYERLNGWTICATKFAGTIYLSHFRTEEEEQQELNMNDQQKLMTSWGHKFEQYMASDSPTSLPEDPNIPTNECRGFYSVLRTSINRFSALVSAEIDCIRPEFESQHRQGTSSTAGYIELKTSRIVDDIRRERNLHRKMNAWWTQSFIVGVPTVICGFRDDNGVVRHVKEYSTDDLPRIAQGGLQVLVVPWKRNPV